MVVVTSGFCGFHTDVLTQGDVRDHAAEYERRQEGQGDDEAVEEAVIAFSHAVPHPWAVVIKPF